MSGLPERRGRVKRYAAAKEGVAVPPNGRPSLNAPLNARKGGRLPIRAGAAVSTSAPSYVFIFPTRSRGARPRGLRLSASCAVSNASSAPSAARRLMATISNGSA